ncbi:MAG: insulinase family protein [Cytophagales bacterium]|nr:insulinase family protein [Cytophagales bacterium]
MKNLLLFFSLMAAHGALAQLDRSQLPQPGPAPEINIGSYESFVLKNGLKVFLVEDHKLPQVAFKLVVDRKPLLEGDKAGYSGLAGELLKMGTKSRSKEKIDEEIDFMGASFNTWSTGFYASGLKKNVDGLLGVVSDVLLNPTFPADELEN